MRDLMIQRGLKIAGAGLLALLLCAALPVTAQGGEGEPGAAQEKAPETANVDPTYTIGPDDVLNITVWKEPELTRTVQVRPDGKITLPLINDVYAVGMTPMQLADALAEKLKKFVAEPQVSVIVQTIQSRRVYIMGEISRAGAFPMSPGMTVLQALASAGNFTQFANLKGIYVLRNEGGKQLRFNFNYKEVIKGKKQEQNIQLKPGDTIVVP